MQNLVETVGSEDSLGPLQQGLLADLIDLLLYCVGQGTESQAYAVVPALRLPLSAYLAVCPPRESVRQIGPGLCLVGIVALAFSPFIIFKRCIDVD